MPIIFEREAINYIPKRKLNIVNKNGGALYLPRHRSGNAIYKMGTRYVDGESFGSLLSSAGSWIANNSSIIGNVANAVGSVAGTVTNIVKSSVEIDNLRKQNEAELQALRDKTKAEIEQIRETLKNRKKLNVVDSTEQKTGEVLKYTLDSLKTQPIKPKTSRKTDQIVNKILGRSKRNLIDGEGFKMVYD